MHPLIQVEAVLIFPGVRGTESAGSTGSKWTSQRVPFTPALSSPRNHTGRGGRDSRRIKSHSCRMKEDRFWDVPPAHLEAGLLAPRLKAFPLTGDTHKDPGTRRGARGLVFVSGSY